MQTVGNVMRRGLTIDGGAGRQNNLGRLVVAGAGDQARDIQLIGADPVQRRQGPAEYMIMALEA